MKKKTLVGIFMQQPLQKWKTMEQLYRLPPEKEYQPEFLHWKTAQINVANRTRVNLLI